MSGTRTDYRPTAIPRDRDADDPVWREFYRLSDALERVGDFAVLTQAPEHPQEGMVRFADGVGWDPGSGKGLYEYKDGAWTPLFGGGATALIGFYNPVADLVSSGVGVGAALLPGNDASFESGDYYSIDTAGVCTSSQPNVTGVSMAVGDLILTDGNVWEHQPVAPPGGDQFLRKDIPDTAAGHITLAAGGTTIAPVSGNNIARLTDAQNEAAGVVAGHDANAGAHSGRITQNESDITVIQGEQVVQDGRLDIVEQDIIDMECDCVAHKQDTGNPHLTTYTLTGAGVYADKVVTDHTTAADPHPTIDRMKWIGEWASSGIELFQKNDTVRDGPWTMIANKATEDRPAPQPVGALVWVTDALGGITWGAPLSSTASVIHVGARYTWDQDSYTRQVRLWVPAGTEGMVCALWLVDDPLGAALPQILIPEFTIGPGDVDQWLEWYIGQTFVLQGTVVDVVLMVRTITGETSFSWEWDYKRQNGNPNSGEAWHQSGQNQDDLRFHQNDKDDINRSADLDNIGPGSTITMVSSGQEWTVISAAKAGAVYTFIVEPATRAGEDTSFFTFRYYTAIPIPYVREDNFYSADPRISGIASQTGYENIVVNNHAYGVDLKLQEAYVSPDWDMVAYSGL